MPEEEKKSEREEAMDAFRDTETVHEGLVPLREEVDVKVEVPMYEGSGTKVLVKEGYDQDAGDIPAPEGIDIDHSDDDDAD